jgi:outer membrane lipoprotein-sorting protein
MQNNRKQRSTIASLAAATLLVSFASSAAPAGQPASAPASMAAPQPAATASALSSAPATAASRPTDPRALQILRDLETAGEKYPTLEANVWYFVYKGMVGDEELRTGRVIIARGGEKAPDRFYMRFDTLKQGDGATIKNVIEYALDGQWLTEAKHAVKSLRHIHVAPAGEKVPLFRLGKGPFPMPFGQKVADVLEHFDAFSRPIAKGDPNNTDYVRLVTLPKYKDELSFLRLEMWMDRDTRLPVKLVTEDKNKDVKTAVFSNVRVDARVDEKLFRLDYKASDGWTISREEFQKE